MIESITVTNEKGESLEVELTSPEKSGLVLKSIDGLGPVKATINNTEIVTSDISLFNSARLQTRNIVINFVFQTGTNTEDENGNDISTIEKVRLLTYRYFPVKGNVKLGIKTDQRNAVISGYVESNEPDIFSEQEGCQVSIICPDPFFYQNDGESDSQKFLGTLPIFEFPFENDGFDKKIEFAYIQHYPSQTINYEGDYNAGLTINIHANGTIYNPVIYNLATGETMGINTNKIKELTGEDFKAGEDIVINTKTGSKTVTLIRNGKRINIIAALKSYSTWFRLEKGENLFTYDAEYGGENVEITYTFPLTYEGI